MRVGAFAYQFATAGSNAILRVAAKVVVYRNPAAAIKSPFLLVSNHVSHFDPPLLSWAVPATIDWMADAPLFSRWWSRAFFRAVHAFPVDRGNPDKSVLKTALARLRSGRNLGMFPEGGIRDGARSVLSGAPLKSGFAALAQLARVPLLPCVILGSDRIYNRRRWLRRGRAPVWVGIGPEIHPAYDGPKHLVREGIARDVARACIDLLHEMRDRFPITDADLPHPPAVRMQEA